MYLKKIKLAVLISFFLSSAIYIPSESQNIIIQDTKSLEEQYSLYDFEEQKKEYSNKKSKKSYEKDETEWLYWYTGGPDNIDIGLDYFTIVSAIRFTPEDLEDYEDGVISKFRIYKGDMPSDAKLRIWQGPSRNNLTEYRNQNIFDDIDSGTQWIEIDLDDPYQIDITEELIVGVEWNDRGGGYFSAASDTIPTNANNKGNLVATSSDVNRWFNLTSSDIEGDWLKEILIDDEDWLYWHEFDNGITNVGINSIRWNSSIRFDTDDLAPYNGWTIEKFRFYVNESPREILMPGVFMNAPLDFVIWQGPIISNLNEKYRQTVPAGELNNQSWTEVDLDEPFVMNVGENLFIGVEWIDTGEGFYPTAFDNITDADGKGNLLNLHGEWTTLTGIGTEGDWLKEIYIKEGEPSFYTITFDVMDINMNPIDDAVVELQGNIKGPGEYSFDEGYSPGTYNYVVSKEGYNNAVDYARIINESIIEEVILIEDKTSIEESEKFSLKIYPNPVTNILYIENNKPIKELNIIDITGRTILSKEIGSSKTELDVSYFEKGLYILNIQSDTSIQSKKIKVNN